MRRNSKTSKALSILISVLMVSGMLPVMAFVSTAATAPVYHGGGWSWRSKESVEDNYYSRFKNNYEEIDLKGPEYVTIVIEENNYYFMQTEDNQEMSYTVNLHGSKNMRANSARFEYVNTDYTNDSSFNSVLSNETWVQSGTVSANNNGDLPDGDEFYGSLPFNASKTAHYAYTATFTANGSAEYHPVWEICFTSGATSFAQTFSTSRTVVDGQYSNINPVFNIKVVDMRELNRLVEIADDISADISDIVAGRDLSGNTYYPQDDIDTMVAAIRGRVLADYSALDAQLARAAQIDDNIVGGLGGALYDEDLYDTFAEKYAQAKAVDRFLTDSDPDNQILIDNSADALAQAIDNLVPTRKALISYYVDGVLFAQNTCSLETQYNFHDVTDKYISNPTKEHYVFSKWTDIDGNYVKPSTAITGDLNVYAAFEVQMNGIAPLSRSGKWNHKMSSDNDDGRGEHYVTMWMGDTTFDTQPDSNDSLVYNFIQIADNETFSFYTDLYAIKNSGTNYAYIKDVVLLNDEASNTFAAQLTANDYLVSYCLTGNAGDFPDGEINGLLPGEFKGLGDDFDYQRVTNTVIWRFIYTFDANGAATYNPKWNILYDAGFSKVTGTSSYSLNESGEYYVNFTINITDARELINIINKAESIYNNPNSYLQFTQSDLDALRSILDDIEANYTLDGSVYYEQSVIDGLVAQIKQVIPDGTQVYCDYTELDAAIALANEKRAEYNDNADNHYINEVWTDFMTAYTAATTVDRNLYIVESNVNQTMIDGLTEDLIEAIGALNYQTHVNVPCDYTGADDVLDEANQINNDNGQYDDDAYQNFEDAKDALEDLLNLYDDEDGNNQAAIDKAIQDLQAAIDALSDSNNQNNPCDYTALNDAIAAAQSVADSDLFDSQTYQNLQDALAAAESIPTNLYDNGTNQTTIDTATADLINAINALLSDAITNAQNVSTDGMDSTTVSDLNNAVTAAETAAADSNASAQDKADAINGITTAVDSLEADKSDLEIALYSANLIDTTDLPQNLVDALDAAVSNGQLVYGDTDASVTSIADATQLITSAIADILQQVIDDASNIDTSGMTSNSIQDLEDAIDNAQAIHDDSNSNAYTLADAIGEVQSATEGLEIDRQSLEDAIADAEAIDTSLYTSDSAADLADAIADAENVLRNPDATGQDILDAIDGIDNAVNALKPDKSTLEQTIISAQNESNEPMYVDDQNMQNLLDTISDAQDVVDDENATLQEVLDAIDAINDALNMLNVKADLNVTVYDEDGNVINAFNIPYGAEMTFADVSNQLPTDLSPYVGTDEVFLGWTDYYGDYYSDTDTFADPLNANILLSKQSTLITEADTADIAVDRFTENTTDYIYMVGLNAAGTSVNDIVAQLKNRDTEIIVTAADGATELVGNNLVGTGCIVKCVNALDHNIVYEEATVILYGDINGDGIVDGIDYNALKDNAFSGADSIAAGTVYFYAADLDGDKALDAFDCFYLNGIQTGGRYFDQNVELYK